MNIRLSNSCLAYLLTIDAENIRALSIYFQYFRERNIGAPVFWGYFGVLLSVFTFILIIHR